LELTVSCHGSAALADNAATQANIIITRDFTQRTLDHDP